MTGGGVVELNDLPVVEFPLQRFTIAMDDKCCLETQVYFSYVFFLQYNKIKFFIADS